MEAPEINRKKINEYAAKSAHTYLEYLNQNERYKGVIRIDILKYTKTNEPYEYILKLSRKIREDCIDYVIYEIDNVIYETNDIEATYYDEDTRLLTVKITGKDLQKRFAEHKTEKIVVISDLKFLVGRVENWYICNEKNFSVPQESHSIVPDEGLYLPTLIPGDEQKRAINQILYGNPWAKPNDCYDQKPFTYVWGPPGTGKTQVVLAYSVLNYLSYLKNHPEQKLLLTAPTNVALDQMLFSLIAVLDQHYIPLKDTICRIGIPTNAFREQYPYLCHRDKDFENHLLKDLNRIKLQINKTQKELQSNIRKLAEAETDATPIEENPLLLEIDQKREQIKKLKTKEQELKKELENDNELIRDTHGIPIIACTLDGYIAHNLEQAFSYAHIFLDEAGYASLIKAGVLFVNDCPITFLGDHMQLNPICEMTDHITKDSDTETVVLWEQSALYMPDFLSCNHEKIIEKYTNHTNYDDTSITDYNELETVFLSKTFRFGSSLSNILNEYIYKNKENPFQSAKEKNQTNLYYIHAPLTTEREKKRDNIAEANAIKRFLDAYAPDSDVGILTAYTNQIKCLTKELADSPVIKNQPDKIFTVHATQGHEWDTVIFSVSDNSSAEKFFTDTIRKDSGGAHVINTAVSRAKRNLILVCDYNYWNKQENQMLTELLKISDKIIADQPETYPEIKTLTEPENTAKVIPKPAQTKKAAHSPTKKHKNSLSISSNLKYYYIQTNENSFSGIKSLKMLLDKYSSEIDCGITSNRIENLSLLRSTVQNTAAEIFPLSKASNERYATVILLLDDSVQTDPYHSIRTVAALAKYTIILICNKDKWQQKNYRILNTYFYNAKEIDFRYIETLPPLAKKEGFRPIPKPETQKIAHSPAPVKQPTNKEPFPDPKKEEIVFTSKEIKTTAEAVTQQNTSRPKLPEAQKEKKKFDPDVLILIPWIAFIAGFCLLLGINFILAIIDAIRRMFS